MSFCRLSLSRVRAKAWRIGRGLHPYGSCRCRGSIFCDNQDIQAGENVDNEWILRLGRPLLGDYLISLGIIISVFRMDFKWLTALFYFLLYLLDNTGFSRVTRVVI